MEKIIELLKNTDGVSAFEVSSEVIKQKELYFVRKNLETNRANHRTNTTITIYTDFDEYRGSSSFDVLASDDLSTISNKIQLTLNKAKNVKNKWYPLVSKSENINETLQLKSSLNDIALSIADAIFAGDHYDDGQLNATEIFVSLKQKTFVNSEGIGHHYDEFSASFETIPTWKGKDEEVELYDYYRMENIDTNVITAHIEEILSFAQKRAEAVSVKEVKVDPNIPVVIQSDMISLISREIQNEAIYGNHYLGMNKFKLNEKIANTPFTMVLKGKEDGLTASSPVDSHGKILNEKTIVKEGKIVDLWGDHRYGYYLNQESVTGMLNCRILDAPRIDDKEIFQNKHLLLCNFSAPQIEWDTGYFGGEVRLGLYFDGEKYIPLSGFSIVGNIFDSLENIRFSTENTVINGSSSYKGPRYWILDKVSIN